MRYFITFACYGGHLHGDESGSVDRRHNLHGSRLLESDPQRAATFRRTAVRHMRRAGVPQVVRLKIIGHRTGSMERRYNIVDINSARETMRKRRKDED
jgi:hypothetical protein